MEYILTSNICLLCISVYTFMWFDSLINRLWWCPCHSFGHVHQVVTEMSSDELCAVLNKAKTAYPPPLLPLHVMSAWGVSQSPTSSADKGQKMHNSHFEASLSSYTVVCNLSCYTMYHTQFSVFYNCPVLGREINSFHFYLTHVVNSYSWYKWLTQWRGSEASNWTHFIQASEQKGLGKILHHSFIGGQTDIINIGQLQ